MTIAFSWLDEVEALSPVNLTIREAARTAENPLNLRYRALFPRVPSSSIKISTISKVDFRPTGGRREWNAQGREIPEKLGPAREFEMVPINPTHHIDERAMQKLREPGVEELVRRGVIHSVDTWPTALADAVERQNERDAFEAWFTGAATVMDPKSGQTVSVDLDFTDGECYVSEGTAWDDASVDPYERFLVHLQAAYTKFGSIGGARMPRAVANLIVAATPDGVGGLRPTITSVQARVREEGFPNFTLVLDDRTYHEFTDGGSAHSSAQYVPDGHIGFMPENGQIGNTHVAPVARAYDFLTGGNRSLANGCVIFRSEKNDGKTLLIEAQENSIVMPDEQFVYVVDTGV